MRFNPIYNECEIASKRLPDQLKVKRLKTQKKKAKKKTKTLKRKDITIKDLIESGILGSDSSSGKNNDSISYNDSGDVIITENLYPKSINKSVLNQNLKKKTQNFSTRLEGLMNEYSTHKTSAKKHVKFKPNTLLQEGGDNTVATHTSDIIKDMRKEYTKQLSPQTQSIQLKTQMPKYEIILRETIIKDKKFDQKPIGKKELTEIISKSEKTNSETIGDKSSIKHLKKGTSFSPELNKELIEIASDESLLLEDCDTLQTSKIPKIKMMVNGRNKCVAYTEKIAQEHMLKILNDKKPLDCSKIIAPRQVLSNCWFNAMFMVYFISDKGRKFNKFFRQLMIVGKTLNGEKIPTNLHKIFFKLNMSIEACINSNMGKKSPLNKIANNLNTNIYIKQIHKIIKDSEIRGVNMSGNPMRYYESLISYIGSQKPVFMTANIGLSHSNGSRTWLEQVKKKQKELGEIPDVIILELYFDNDNDYLSEKSRKNKREINFNLDIENENGNREIIKYGLDSAVIRNTEKHHFSSTITCNKQDFAFDGLSFSRLIPFNWKNKLNSDINWSFDYKGKEEIYFNFTNGYQLLFYYRI